MKVSLQLSVDFSLWTTTKFKKHFTNVTSSFLFHFFLSQKQKQRATNCKNNRKIKLVLKQRCCRTINMEIVEILGVILTDDSNVWLSLLFHTAKIQSFMKMMKFMPGGRHYSDLSRRGLCSARTTVTWIFVMIVVKIR